VELLEAEVARLREQMAALAALDSVRPFEPPISGMTGT
jgi:hypothetical protein